MTKLETLIQTLCPNGVKFVKLDSIATISIGEFVHKNKQTPDGQYPVYNGGTSNTGFYTEYNQTANKIIVSARGANAGFVNKITVPYWAGNSCYTIDVTDEQTNWVYIYYYLKQIEKQILGHQQLGSIPAVSKKQMQELQIPLPPLAVQSEIVRILDKFTLYKAELAAELAARLQQYEYYRDQLLTFDDTVKRVKLGEVAEISRGVRVVRKDLLTSGEIPVYQNSLKPLGYFGQYNTPACTTFVISAGAAGEIGFSNVDYWAADDCLRIIGNKIDNKYVYYWLLNNQNKILSQVRKASIPRLSKDVIINFPIPLPPLSEQERIVSILDRFDKLCHDIREGLPAEIDLRQKQYEHYRDKLLTFEAKG